MPDARPRTDVAFAAGPMDLTSLTPEEYEMTKKTTSQVTNEICASITDRIVASLNEGVVPWRKPWKGGDSGLPSNAATGRQYNGVNVWNLLLAAQYKGYSDPRWLTFRQAQSKGGVVRKGEKAELAIFWKIIKRKSESTPGHDDNFAFLKAYRVFNVEQCDDLELPEVEVCEQVVDPITRGEQIIDGYAGELAGGFSQGGSRAYYRPTDDSVRVPKIEKFESAESFYSTVFHEFAHSTGHRSKNNRDGITNHGAFASHEYAREELVAEFGASYICGVAGIERDDSIAQSAAYIAGWKKKLADDPRSIVVAAGQGEKAARRVLGRWPEEVEPEGKEES